MQNKILIVDDERSIIQQVKTLLDSFGYKSAYIPRAEFLTKRLESDSFDLILMDINMPGIDGITALKQLKANPKFSEIPVIMMTGDTSDDTLETCFTHGADDYITKPIGELILKARVKSVIEKQNFIREIHQSEQKLKVIINTSLSGIGVSSISGNFIYTNSIFPEMFGYSKEEFLELTYFQLIPNYDIEDAKDRFNELISGRINYLNIIREYIRKDKTTFWGHISVSIINDMNGNPENIVSYLTDIDKLKRSEIEIKHSHKKIKDSINYAKRIQSALMPSLIVLEQILPEHFVIYKPKEVVSGDFYFAKQVNDYFIIAVGDCTGHGVPGAFMSLFGVSFLNEIIQRKEISKTNQILDELRNQIKKLLHQTNDDKSIQDGMDLSICAYHPKKQMLQYSGANIPLYFFRNNELNKVSADKMPVGVYLKEFPFTNHEFNISENDIFYMLTDGYVDQIGEKAKRKFMKPQFKKLLTEIHTKPFDEQEKILIKTYEDWKGNYQQIDDILIMGFKLPSIDNISLDMNKYNWSNKHILIAEDIPDNFILLKSILESTQIQILWAKNGKEAIEQCKTNPDIDIVLMDIMMPIADGYTATSIIKKFRKELPIIVQTAFFKSNEKEKSFQAGCDDYITKPINEKELFATIDKYIN